MRDGGLDQPDYGQTLGPVSRRGREIVRNNKVLRHVGRWLLHRSTRLRAAVFEQFAPQSVAMYRRWVARYDSLTLDDIAAIRNHCGQLPPAAFTVVLLADAAPAAVVQSQIASVLGQLYPHWDLVVAAGPSVAVDTGALPDDRPRQNVRVLTGEDPAAILTAIASPYCAVVAGGTVLCPQALYEAACAIASGPAPDIIYADEDVIDIQGQRRQPWFKTDWSLDLQRGQNVLGSLGIFRTALLRRAGGLPSTGEPRAMYGLALRAAEAAQPNAIVHIPAILSHRLAASDATPAASGDVAALQQHLERTGETCATAQPHPTVPGCLRVVRALPDAPPLVSLVVPTRDQAGLLAICADGLLHKTRYPNLELILVDNGSTEADAVALLAELGKLPNVRVLRSAAPFNFSALNNLGAAAARGDLLVLVNNDIDVIDGDWLNELVVNALRPDVGAVGAKLLYPDGRLQHGGVALGVGGIAGHLELLAHRNAPGYGARLALTRDVSAVTGACLAIRRAVFHEAGGFDEQNLAVAYNDIDLCLRVRERGYRVLWTPFAELLHHESASRKFDLEPEELPRFAREVAYMRARWGHLLDSDPFYGPNFSLRDGHYHLSAPRRVPPWRRDGAPDASAAAAAPRPARVGRSYAAETPALAARAPREISL